MKGVLIPGYDELFNEPALKYEDVLANVSSDIIMMLLISLNAELNVSENHICKQERLLSGVTKRFSSEQLSKVNQGIQNFKKENPIYDGTLFGRRYLLSMFMKELKRQEKKCDNPNDPTHEYNFFIAYLQTINEVNEEDHLLIDNAQKYECLVMPAFPMIWAAAINQYEFNEVSNPAFEILKLLSFCKYAYDKYKFYLKELITKKGFVNISQYLGSFTQIIMAAQINHPDEILKKLYFISPKEEVAINYLRMQSVNQIFDKTEITVSDLKKMPLYETDKRGFMIIDEDMFKKKIYRGALFELNKETSLREKISFENYKTDISKECFEDVLFKGIVKHLYVSDLDITHFDSNSNVGKPDLYYRHGNNVFLIEFKDYLFPDTLISGREFKNYEEYINERLIKSDKNKEKGVTQLVNNICNLFSNKYDFDVELNSMLKKNEKIFIHPIICHTDFMFSMPGLNEYLNCVFEKKIYEKGCNREGINRVTVVNLETLFDLALRGGNFNELLNFIKQYCNVISLKRRIATEIKSSDLYIESTTSFDEMYQLIFRTEMIDKGRLTNKDATNSIKDIIGISQQEIDEVL